MKLRIGTGVDVHDLQAGEDLVLGGVKIPSDIGITGHSDGDLILHALVDSILGALAIGDIGQFFPSDDDKWKNADSKIFLDFALEKMKSYGFSINNIDITVVVQNIRINPHATIIRKSISKLCNIDLSQVSLKATTTDKLGFLGRGEGIASFITILLSDNYDSH